MKPGWMLAALGGIGLLLSLAVLAISLLVPIVNAPNADFDEAIPFLIGGCCCSAVSVVIVLLGVMLLIVGRKPS